MSGPARPVVTLEEDPARKRRVQEALTALLGDWFGQPESNLHYAQQAETLPGFVAELSGQAKGLLLLKRSSPISSEVYWMGVDPACHRCGIGHALVEAASGAARRDGVQFLFVATLHPSADYEPYRRTQHFYEALGFRFVLEEQFPDPENPMAFYMKSLV